MYIDDLSADRWNLSPGTRASDSDNVDAADSMIAEMSRVATNHQLRTSMAFPHDGSDADDW